MRKNILIKIEAEGRDKGKVFLLREMPAVQAEKWAARAFLAMARSDVDIPADVAGTGMAGIAIVGLKALGGVTFELAEPLMDEMMACVAIVPDPGRPEVTRALIVDDFEEVRTILQLRKELLTLHTGFSIPAFNPTSASVESGTVKNT